MPNSLSCTLDGGPFLLGEPWGDNDLGINEDVECSFAVSVLDDWTDEGYIPGITVSPSFAPFNTAATPAAIFYVEPKMFAPEMVYTNSAMSYITTNVVTNDVDSSIDPNTYYTGE